jgi:hypothetical protein
VQVCCERYPARQSSELDRPSSFLKPSTAVDRQGRAKYRRIGWNRQASGPQGSRSSLEP